jgi:hypothetical protein
MSEKSGLLNRLMDNMIKGIKTKTKSVPFAESNTRTRKQGPIEKAFKLRELAKMIKGL